MNSTRKIGLLLALVFLLPALFFSVYEISSLNKDEKMIQEIYSKQLEAILFSVNQYSDDILNSWISKIETHIQGPTVKDSIPVGIKELLTFNTSIISVFSYDTIQGEPAHRMFCLEDTVSNLLANVESSLLLNKDKIKQLIEYKKNGFRKMEALKLSGNRDILIFITEGSSKIHLAGLVIDPEIFISDLVGPRLQTIAKDQFVLSAFKKGVAVPVYSTFSGDTTRLVAEALTKSFWLFPDYTIGIRTQGRSLQKLVDERTTTNLLLLISLDIILIIAVVMVFRNVRKEVQLAQNKSDFVSNVSHEIRTPLALISMFAETLEMDRVNSEEKKKEYYQIISKETHRLSGIVNKILNFSQSEANKKALNIETIHLDTEINGVLSTYDFHLRNKGFDYAFIGNPKLWIKADREAFTEVVINLIDNAVKYSDDRKRIEITIGMDNGYGIVAVRDEGIGISTMDQKHIFDKFYRVSTGDLAKSRGTGLGLSLVKQLMETQHGKITVLSELGKGSTFTLHFPLETTR